MRIVGPSVSRRAALAALATLTAVAPPSVPLPVAAISATTMSGKTRPDLGLVLIEAPSVVGNTINAEVLLSDGLIATTAFDTKWPIAEGAYYDVEAKTRDGDAAFLQIQKCTQGKSLATLPKSFFTGAILGVDGRYGAYGAPTDIKVLADSGKDSGSPDLRTLELTFDTLTPGATTIGRKAVVSAIQPKGSADILMLVSSASASRWKKPDIEAEARAAAKSFRVVATRSTSMEQLPSFDYRYGKTTGPSNMKSRNDGF